MLGLIVGSLAGAAGLWAVVRPGDVTDQAATLRAAQSEKAQADGRARESEAGREAAELRHAEAAAALVAANRQAAAAAKERDDAERRLKDALARLEDERGRRASLEKTVAEARKPVPAPTLSFVRDWQLLGPFASSGDRGHDAVFPPEREPVQLQKAYDGFGGPVRWRPCHSAEDKIDLADFYQYHDAGVAYAVSWAYSEGDRDAALGVGSDDGVRVWVNRGQVLDVKGGRQARPGQDVVKVHLRDGWNEILAKVDNIVGTWELYVEFRTADGGSPLKVFSTNSPPPGAGGKDAASR